MQIRVKVEAFVTVVSLLLRVETLVMLTLLLRNVSFFSLRRLGETDVLLFSADANKSEIVVGGQRFDRYLDTLGSHAKRMGFSTKCISWPGSFYHGNKTLSESLNISWPFLIALAKDALSGEPKSEKYRIKLFQEILKAIRPRVIFTIGGSSDLRSACSSLGIPCVEVLHARGYHTSPELWFARRELPSHALVFDELSRDLLHKHFGQKCEVILTKDHWTSAWRDNNRGPRPPTSVTLPRFEFGPVISDVEYRILVSLQWGYAGDSTRYKEHAREKIFENGLFPLSILEVIDALGDRAFWHFRLHPVQLNSRRRLYYKQRNYLKRLFSRRSNVDVLNASFAPLPALLSECTHNITTSSSLCYEAAEFGVPTLTTSPLLINGGALEDRFRDLVDEGYLRKAEPDSAEIVSWVLSTKPMAHRNKGSLGLPIEDVIYKFGKGM